MRRNVRNKRDPRGFTLVEILTALAVISVLVALLVPALSMVEKKAKIVKQKARFHAIEMGLEAHRSDRGDYPPSQFSPISYGPGSIAAFRMAEALIGRDGLGFHPLSRFRQGGQAHLDGDTTLDPTSDPPTIYSPVAGFTSSTGSVIQTGPENVAARQGPYLELETANASLISNYYSNLGGLDDTYVLADVFKKKMTDSGKELGMPILYYRAHTDRIGNDPTPAWAGSPLFTFWPTNTYDLNDNFRIVARNVPFQSSYTNHPLADSNTDVDAANKFYGAIANPNFTAPPRPYRANSFLLHSAGPDGLYGTLDDMFNF